MDDTGRFWSWLFFMIGIVGLIVMVDSLLL